MGNGRRIEQFCSNSDQLERLSYPRQFSFWVLSAPAFVCIRCQLRTDGTMRKYGLLCDGNGNECKGLYQPFFQ